MWFAYQFNPAYLLTYLSIGWLLLVFSYSALWQTYVAPILNHLFFREELRNKLLSGQHQVRTHDEIKQDKVYQELRGPGNHE